MSTPITAAGGSGRQALRRRLLSAAGFFLVKSCPLPGAHSRTQASRRPGSLWPAPTDASHERVAAMSRPIAPAGAPDEREIDAATARQRPARQRVPERTRPGKRGEWHLVAGSLDHNTVPRMTRSQTNLVLVADHDRPNQASLRRDRSGWKQDLTKLKAHEIRGHDTIPRESMGVHDTPWKGMREHDTPWEGMREHDTL